MTNVLLDVLAFSAIISGILVITAKNPVISVLFLIAVFLNVAGYLILMGVAYLGLVYIIVYVGAIAILFLFVVMILNLQVVELLETGKAYTQNLPLGTVLGALFFFEILSIIPTSYKDAVQGIFQIPYLIMDNFVGPTSEVAQHNNISGNVHTAYNPVTAELSFNNFLQIESIGQGLYTYSTLWLVIGSLILLLSMVGPIVLCINTTKYGDLFVSNIDSDDDSDDDSEDDADYNIYLT